MEFNSRSSEYLVQIIYCCLLLCHIKQENDEYLIYQPMQRRYVGLHLLPFSPRSLSIKFKITISPIFVTIYLFYFTCIYDNMKDFALPMMTSNSTCSA